MPKAPIACARRWIALKERHKMCEAHAFIIKDGKEEKVLENVDLVELEGDEVRLINIFGEQRILKAKLKLYNNSEGKILFEPV